MTVVRYYLPSGSGTGGVNNSPVSVPMGELWVDDYPTTPSALRLLTAPSGTADANRSATETASGSAYTGGAGYQFVSAPVPTGYVVGAARVVMRRSNATTGNTVYLAARLALWRAADGSVVELFGGHNGVGQSSPLFTAPAAELDATPTTSVLTAPGDRLVYEPGLYMENMASATQGGSFRLGDPATGPDLAPGETVANRPWLEVTFLAPPNPPENLTAAPRSSSVDLTWDPPATGPVPTGYELRVDGGAATDVGDVTSWTVTGLAPLTTYTLEVRAYTETGPSAWATVEATTTEAAEYRALVRLGDHTWDVAAGDPPELGPILPLSFGWLVPEDSAGFPAQPDPDTCQLELVTATAADLAGVDIATPVRVSIYTTDDPAARPFATFVGRVGDLEAAPHHLGLAWRILAVGYTADPGTRQVGTADWPTESGDARLARIMTEAGFPGWAADPVAVTFEARGGQATTAKAELDRSVEAAVTTEGTAYGPSRRVLYHPNVDAAGDLDPAAPFGGAAVLRRTDHIDRVTAGLINRRTTWRRTKLLDATWVRIDHLGGPTTYGDTRGPAYPPMTVPVTDPAELADLILDTIPGYRWLTGDALRIEMWADEAAITPLEWFYRDTASPPFPWSGRVVVVENIAQAPDGSTTYAGMLAGARLILEPGGRLVVEFRLRPEIPAASTVTMRWIDEPPTATWADEAASDPTGSWFDYRTTPRP